MGPRPDGSVGVLYDNGSGEDFLYMHRQMIAQVNAVLAAVDQADYPRVEGWKMLPLHDDPDYPVPAAWKTGGAGLDAYLENVKRKAFREQPGEGLHDWAARLTDDAYLSKLTLGQLGARLEFTVHNWLHMRFCSRVDPMRPDDESPDEATIDKQWDAPSYDWLGDTYSSHVNPVFWKIHGWVDDRIDQWARVHKVQQIAWKGTWVGNMPGQASPNLLVADKPAKAVFSTVNAMAHGHEHGGGHGHPPGHGHGDMEEVLEIVLKSGVRCHFYDEHLVEAEVASASASSGARGVAHAAAGAG